MQDLACIDFATRLAALVPSVYSCGDVRPLLIVQLSLRESLGKMPQLSMRLELRILGLLAVRAVLLCNALASAAR